MILFTFLDLIALRFIIPVIGHNHRMAIDGNRCPFARMVAFWWALSLTFEDDYLSRFAIRRSMIVFGLNELAHLNCNEQRPDSGRTFLLPDIFARAASLAAIEEEMK